MRLPPGVIRMFGRMEKAAPTMGPIIRRVVRSIQTEDGVIGHGAGVGLRFNPAGANPGYVFGTTEPVMQAEIAELLAPGLVFYDIGANVGFFSLIAARCVGADGAVYAFEPLPANADALAHNVAINGFENVELVRAAVSRGPGRAELAVTASSVQAHLADVDTGVPTVSTTTVDVTSVDAAVRSGLRPPDVVKIDVEGAELAVLEGMSGRWPSTGRGSCASCTARAQRSARSSTTIRIACDRSIRSTVRSARSRVTSTSSASPSDRPTVGRQIGLLPGRPLHLDAERDTCLGLRVVLAARTRRSRRAEPA
jgi:FkbM family methyltransferase